MTYIKLVPAIFILNLVTKLCVVYGVDDLDGRGRFVVFVNNFGFSLAIGSTISAGVISGSELKGISFIAQPNRKREYKKKKRDRNRYNPGVAADSGFTVPTMSDAKAVRAKSSASDVPHANTALTGMDTRRDRPRVIGWY